MGSHCHIIYDIYMTHNLEEFMDGYISAALGTTTDQNLADSETGFGPELDKNYSASDLEEDLLASIKKDCQEFLQTHEKDIQTYMEVVGKTEHDAGYCFWMERTGEGVSFTDFGYPGKPGYEAAERLADAGRMYPNQDWYAYDGQITASGLEHGLPLLDEKSPADLDDELGSVGDDNVSLRNL